MLQQVQCARCGPWEVGHPVWGRSGTRALLFGCQRVVIVLFRPWLLPGRVERVDGSTSVLDRPVSDVLTLQFLGPAQPGVRQHGHRGARGDA